MLIAIFGVQVIPSLLYLIPTPTTLTARAGYGVVGLFAVGVLVLVGYLAVYAHRLHYGVTRPASEHPPLPGKTPLD